MPKRKLLPSSVRRRLAAQSGQRNSKAETAEKPAGKPSDKTWAECYADLPELEKQFLQIFSVIYEPVSRTGFVNLLKAADYAHEGYYTYTPQTFKPNFDHLMAQGLLLEGAGMGLQCEPEVAEIATRAAIEDGIFEALVDLIEVHLPISRRGLRGSRYFRSIEQCIRDIRIGLYRHDWLSLEQAWQDFLLNNNRTSWRLETILSQLVTTGFDPDWLDSLPAHIRFSLLSVYLNTSFWNVQPTTKLLNYLQARGQRADADLREQALYGEQLLYRGDILMTPPSLQALEQRAKEFVQERHQGVIAPVKGLVFLLQGDTQKAVTQFELGLAALASPKSKRNVYFDSLMGVWTILALLRAGTPADFDKALDYAKRGSNLKNLFQPAYDLLTQVIKIQQGDLTLRQNLLFEPITPNSHQGLQALLWCLSLYWIDAGQAKQGVINSLITLRTQAESAAYDWLAMEAMTLILRWQSNAAEEDIVSSFWQQHQQVSLVEVIPRRDAWELSLVALTNLGQPNHLPDTSTAAVNNDKRLVWLVSGHENWGFSVSPREQIFSSKGWSSGRAIALKRLYKQPDDFLYLSSQDREICSHLKMSYDYNYYGYGSSPSYGFDSMVFASLIGHPLVFWESSPSTKVEIVKGELELRVTKTNQSKLILELSLPLVDKLKLAIQKETPTRLRVITIKPEHLRIAEILGPKNRLVVPEKAETQVLTAIHSISALVTVHSDIGGGDLNLREVPADPRPHIHIMPYEAGLKLAILVRPFEQGGAYYQPGSGGENVIAEIGGERLRASRDLAAERDLAAAVLTACPMLERQNVLEGEWLIPDPQDSLEVLLELQALGEQVVIAWPAGEKMRIKHRADLADFSLSIRQQQDWFATEGELQLDNQQVLDLQQLMQLLSQTNSRFLPLGDGQFLALTEKFRQRLDDLRAYTEKSGKGLRLHPLAALGLEDWVEEVGELQVDKHWQQHIQRLQEVQNLDPKLPSTLQAELRDYQLEGFQWLARLAHWGVGACLADDMGLGKTLQALALILSRAPEGPTLVIAPTSVCANWLTEGQRFAPTLNLLQLAQLSNQERQEILTHLQAFDLLVCSYGLLQQPELAEMLAKVEWQTIVLDEAQSIKNFATKRSQGAMNLQGKFKLLTTGTPVENSLSELWNLFRFINPGLLSSLENFNQRFATPIERYNDKAARQQLKKLVQPFILRRTKSQVLAELPSRTEIVLDVELSKEELAFYEALRRQAVDRLADSDAQAGAKHLQVLAEIMRLRRACCHSQLVQPELSLPSSKLQLFGEVLAELLANHHKALVFSQFVDHLTIIRNYLDEQGISYQYLDGSTPAAQRQKRVKAFQAGDGDVFLISLKAGGTGLNLTAADYVIHMDPWWNPAVEDQASDRAHRIGQQRPVTIYRLVTKHTIEEKIVQLHHLKRDLADSLLAGTDSSGKLSTQELLALMQAG
jgi:SNF2-related domain/Helicase conserved C-terminal domain